MSFSLFVCIVFYNVLLVDVSEMPLRDILTIRTFREIASCFCVVLLLELFVLKVMKTTWIASPRLAKMDWTAWIAALWLAKTNGDGRARSVFATS